MNITFRAYKQNGTTVNLKSVLSMRYKMAMYDSGNEMEFTLLQGEIPSDFTRIIVANGGAMLFDGYIEQRYKVTGEEGVFEKIISKSNGARLSDVQVKKETLFSYTGNMIAQKFAAAYGVSQNSLPGGTFDILYMDNDMTAWQAINVFCRQKYGLIPRIDRNGILTVNILSGRSHRISNTASNGLRYISSDLIYDRSKMISKVYVKESGFTGNEDFTIVLDNQKAQEAGIVRIRYHEPTVSWFPWPGQSGREIIKDSMIDETAWVACVSGLHDIYPGDAIVPDNGIFSGTLYAGEVRMLADETGAYTYIKAYALANNTVTL